jgi:arylsulfatase A-like enzyme
VTARLTAVLRRLVVVLCSVALHGKKRDLYEGGLRVPMIAWGPGRIPAAGRTVDQPWAAWDVLPTTADLLGRAPPPGLSGRSMAGVLTGDREKGERRSEPRSLYWEYLRSGQYRQALRRGRWKRESRECRVVRRANWKQKTKTQPVRRRNLRPSTLNLQP